MNCNLTQRLFCGSPHTRNFLSFLPRFGGIHAIDTPQGSIKFNSIQKSVPVASSLSRLFSLLFLPLILVASGCASYKGGKVVDGMNLELGMTIPSTELSFNFLSYTSGVVVKGNDETNITVTHELVEKNSYFGVVDIEKSSKLTTEIKPKKRTKAE